MAGGEAEDCRGVRGQRGARTRGRRDGAWLDRADRAASVYRQVRRSAYSRIEGSGVGVSFMAVGSLVLAIHSVEGSVAPVRRRRARWQPCGHQSTCAAGTLLGFLGDAHRPANNDDDARPSAGCDDCVGCRRVPADPRALGARVRRPWRAALRPHRSPPPLQPGCPGSSGGARVTQSAPSEKTRAKRSTCSLAWRACR
jgi:hypothetical protein